MTIISQLFGGDRGVNSLILDALNASQGIIIVDSHSGDVKQVNSYLCNLLKLPEASIVGSPLQKFCHDPVTAQSLAARYNGQKSFNNNVSATELEFYMPCEVSGHIIWLALDFIVESDNNRTIIFVKDTTQKKQQQESDIANAHYANALMQCQANVMLVNNDLNIVCMNDAVKAMLDRNRHSLQSSLLDFNSTQLIDTSINQFLGNENHHQERLKHLDATYKTDIHIGELTFGLVATPWVDNQGKRLGVLVEWIDKTEQLVHDQQAASAAQENLRIRQALDVCDTSVMLADTDLNISYLNNAVQKMLTAREHQIKQLLPNFNAAKLVGSNVDAFHKNPSHQRNVLSDLKESYKTDLALGELTFGLLATPIFDDKGKRSGTVVEWKDRTEELAALAKEQKVFAENMRVRQALDAVSSNVMIADADANIIYMNNSVKDLMQGVESELRQDLPNFNASQLVGENIDAFHKNPAHQRNMLATLKDTYNGNIIVGGRHFGLIANPVVVEGQRIGTVVEWSDKTAEVKIEQEVDSMLEAALAGDFTKQLRLDDKKGFFANLSKGLNTLVSTVEVSLNDVLRILGAMAKGDLSERITRDYHGAFAQLKTDANATADKLTEVTSKIWSSAGAIGTAANEIAQGNADLSQRTEEQASSLQETASSMEQMTSAVRQSSDNARQANELSDQAKLKARSGGEVVSKAIQAMDDINVASKKISDIIGVIDEIAFQTNLLALNAAVEAARAGEQGRGFAVVAGEVRNLAQRSAGAAKEIKDLIRDSVVKVEDGSELVNASGETLTEIVAAVDKVSNMMREIADAAQEQTSGIEQVNTTISQMDEMTQQNAALVEEASAAGQAMADQARAMNAVVEFFNVGKRRGHEVDVTPPANLVAESAVARPVAMASGMKASSISTVNKPKVAVKREPNIATQQKQKAPPVRTPSPPVQPTTSYANDDEWEEF